MRSFYTALAPGGKNAEILLVAQDDDSFLTSGVPEDKLEGHFQAELDLAGSAQGEYTRSGTNAIGRAFGHGGAVERTRSAAQHSTQTVAVAVEVGEVENVEGRHAGLQNKAVAKLEGPRQSDIEGAQPCQSCISGGSSLDGRRICAQLKQLRSGEQARIHQRLAGWCQLVCEVRVVVIDDRVEFVGFHCASE